MITGIYNFELLYLDNNITLHYTHRYTYYIYSYTDYSYYIHSNFLCFYKSNMLISHLSEITIELKPYTNSDIMAVF